MLRSAACAFLGTVACLALIWNLVINKKEMVDVNLIRKSAASDLDWLEEL
jgi:hypothetical protein